MEDKNQVHCPKCNSISLSANKKGFSGGKALAGGVLLGPLGVLAGTAGSKKITITCLNCGHRFSPGHGAKQSALQPKLIWDEVQKKHVVNPAYKTPSASTGGAGVFVIVIFALLLLFIVKSCNN